MAGQQRGQAGLVQHVTLLCGDVGLAGDLLGVAGNGGDGVAAAGQFGDDARAGITGRADDGDLHQGSPCDGIEVVSNGD
jgi:hypothetical protein